MGFLIEHYKGKYRIKCPYDEWTYEFPRTLKGTYDETDCYITCVDSCKIFHYGHGVLEFYCQKIGKGRNIIRRIYRDFINEANTEEYDSVKIGRGGKEVVTKIVKIIDNKLFEEQINSGKEIIFDLVETDEEVMFKFKHFAMDKLDNILKPLTIGADISPFSVKNLPKNSSYSIPNVELREYKKITENLGENSMNKIRLYASLFLEKISTKKNTLNQIKMDMKKKGLKTKEYIHSIGKWNEYIKFIEKKISEGNV